MSIISQNALHLETSFPANMAGEDQSASLPLAAGERWYAVLTLPRKESYAADNLRRQCIRCFLPRHLVTLRHARRFRTVLSPVFPRYLFVGLDVEAQRWRAVNGTFGVQSLLCVNDRPQPVPRGVVETLIEAIDSDGRPQRTPSFLKPGAKVKLLSGPFAGLPGVLERLDGPKRVQLLLEIMGGTLVVSVPTETLGAL